MECMSIISKGSQSSRLTRWMVVSCIALECLIWGIAQIAKMLVLTINNAHVQVILPHHTSLMLILLHTSMCRPFQQSFGWDVLTFCWRNIFMWSRQPCRLECGHLPIHPFWMLHEYMMNFLSWALKYMRNLGIVWIMRTCHNANI